MKNPATAGMPGLPLAFLLLFTAIISQSRHASPLTTYLQYCFICRLWNVRNWRSVCIHEGRRPILVGLWAVVRLCSSGSVPFWNGLPREGWPRIRSCPYSSDNLLRALLRLREFSLPVLCLCRAFYFAVDHCVEILLGLAADFRTLRSFKGRNVTQILLYELL